MDTNELSRALNVLARYLRSLPKTNIEDLKQVYDLESIRASARKQYLDAGKGLGLNSLLTLSKIDKKQLINFIAVNKLPINVRSRDSSWDMLGKLVRFLGSHYDITKQLSLNLYDSSKVSPELMNALSILLKE